MVVAAACAFIVAAVLYSAWVTGQFTTPAVDRTEGYVGELAALDQPWTRLFRVSDVGAGLACLLGVALTPVQRREWPGWLALAAFGLLTAATGVFPLDCAALSDPACGRHALSLPHRAHTVTAALAAVSAPAAMALLGASWRARLSWLLSGMTTGAVAVTAAAVVLGHLAGVAHRVQLALVAAWLVYAAMRLLVAAPVPPTVSPTMPPPVPPPVPPTMPGEGGTPHVVAQGDGPAVILAPGTGRSWFHWEPVAGALAGARRVVRFDRPGLGLSPPSPLPPTLYAEAARLAALAPAHPERVTVVAHRDACWHAEAFARLHPLRVERLVLVDPPCPKRRGRAAPADPVVRWLPALGGAWGAAALARVAGPAVNRLLSGLPDPCGVYRRGRVLAAAAGERLSRGRMASDLLAVRSGMPFPRVPVTVLGPRRGAGCARAVASELGGVLVRLPGPRRRILADHAGSVAAAAEGA
ncbi:Alpha/beta hydrolase family protein [Nonomuraea pusilla]|uniref:Alpha/beta hydrolase family protein n=1 Tax=Nonomuraea pusilla TaxID=46177 RepID=A0A1H7N9G5_9ACTN|nr:Alpha/beta hydrolase family protein [Nonomuraea pusilla]